MPFHIEEMNTEVTIIDGDLPLTEAQVEKLVQLVIRRLESKSREARLSHEATTINGRVASPLRVAD
jgi:hypothetical protein